MAKKKYILVLPCIAPGAVQKMLKRRLQNYIKVSFPGVKEADCPADLTPSTGKSDPAGIAGKADPGKLQETPICLSGHFMNG